MDPVDWETWIQLPIREFDNYVNTPKYKIRIPTVVVCTEYNKMPHARPKLNKENLAARDGHRCQYSGVILPRSRWSMDHVVPKSRTGKTTWQNVVLADKELNWLKGSKTNEEAGLKLIRQPKAPALMPVTASLQKDKVAHHDWKFFLLK
jgi:5-methylcytosine-specific restriction endonuclease McrA